MKHDMKTWTCDCVWNHHQRSFYFCSLLSPCTLSAKLEVNDTQLWGVFVYNDHSVFSNLSLLFIDSFKIMGRKIASDIKSIVNFQI